MLWTISANVGASRLHASRTCSSTGIADLASCSSRAFSAVSTFVSMTGALLIVMTPNVGVQRRAKRVRCNDGLGGTNSHTKCNTAKSPLAALKKEWLPSRLIPHRHRPRAELQPAYELQVETLR